MTKNGVGSARAIGAPADRRDRELVETNADHRVAHAKAAVQDVEAPDRGLAHGFPFSTLIKHSSRDDE
jgi:hypothetical protein